MTNFASEDQMVVAAQSCRHFSSAKRRNAGAEGLSCGNCSNWSGNKCAKKAFDTVMSSMDIE